MKRELLLSLLLLTLIPIVSAANNETPLSDLSSSFSSTLDKEIQLPESTYWISRIILGIKESTTLTVSLFIIMLAIWIILFLMLANILELTPLFGPTTRWIAAACITIVIALSGIIESFALWFLALGRDIAFIEKWSAGAITFTLVVLIISFIIVQKTLKWAKETSEITKADKEGFEEGIMKRFWKRVKEGFNFLKPY